SYGLHVAELAGMPKGIVRRANEILTELEATSKSTGEQTSRRAAMRTPSSNGQPVIQMTFFGQPDPVLDELKTLDIEALSPLDAITKLFELQRKARKDL